MSKRESLVIVSVCLFTIALLWIFIPVAIPKNDAARYERWKQTERLDGRVIWWERHLPNSFNTLLRLPAHDKKYWEEHERLGDTLVASGYLTNVTIVVASAPTNDVQRAQVVARLDKAFSGRNEWEFWVSGYRHAIVVICRPQDEVLSRQAICE
jgi:hypothetical protein